ncbi:MAG TPA: penicillin-binding transpeptidase domain-containing protein [Acidimicrobiia bacterium]
MKFSSRLVIVSGLFLLMFSALGIRLWFISIAQGAQSAQIVEDQTWIEIPTQAPRGEIVDRTGQLLVTSRFVPAVVVDRRFINTDQAVDLQQRLSGLLGMPVGEIQAAYDKAGINARFRLATVTTDTAYRVTEQLSDLPGVSIEKVPERVYLVGPTMAHVIGHLGFPDEADLEARPDLDLNVRIGQTGVEKVYDELLLGTNGDLALRLNRRAEVVEERPPVASVQGDTIHLSLDLQLQELVESALEQGVALSNQVKQQEKSEGIDFKHETERAAAVVLDVKTGAVLSLASYPDFDPSLFVTGVDPDTFALLQQEQAFNNLAVSGLYPPASTFKAITYVAAEEEDLPLDSPNYDSETGLVHCNGRMELPGFEEGSPQVFNDWYTGDKGWLNLHQSFEESCNIYFWTVALGTWRNYKDTDQEDIIQDWARSLGFGEATGIDLTAEASGIVPDRALFDQWKEEQVENPDEPGRLDPRRLELEDGPWVGGDLMNLAIGQGELIATPLQMAVAYSAMVNGGDVWQPYVVSEIERRDGEIVRLTEPTLLRHVDMSPTTTASLLTDLNKVVTTGTAARAFESFGPGLDQVGGKTGTGQTNANNDNHAWFAGVGPLDDPRWVVVVLIDEGGSGGRIAAPVGRYIMQYLMGVEPTPITAGEKAN